MNMLRLSTAYRLPGQWRALTVGGSLNWQSEIYGSSRRPVGATATGVSSPKTPASISRPTAWPG